MNTWIRLGLAVCTAYLLGSLNPAIFLSRVFTGQDIRTMGSGNAGSTNMYRNLGPKYALLTLLGDFCKTLLAVAAGQLITGGTDIPLGEMGRFAAGIAAVVGHAFPLFHRFRGGKGVVTAAAMVLLFDWRIFLVVFGTFLLFSVATRYISLGSVTGAAALPLAMGLFHPGRPVLLGGSLFVALLIIFLHRGNLRRLLAGKESKFYFRPPEDMKK